VAKGDTGATGPTGPQGLQGLQGVQGPQGLKGDTGAAGAQGLQGLPGADGSNVTVSAAPAITCPTGGAAITDGFQHTQYVCDGHTGPQGPQGAQGPTGSATVFAQTWINSSAFSAPVFNCCSTDWVITPATTLPNTTFSGTTTGAPLLIQATIPLSSANQGAAVYCQPNIDSHWAGSPLGSALFDYTFLFNNTPAKVNVTISRVYPAPPAGQHTFSLACAAGLSGVSLIQSSVVSYAVFELR
jgi:hypothetical protein